VIMYPKANGPNIFKTVPDEILWEITEFLGMKEFIGMKALDKDASKKINNLMKSNYFFLSFSDETIFDKLRWWAKKDPEEFCKFYKEYMLKNAKSKIHYFNEGGFKEIDYKAARQILLFTMYRVLEGNESLSDKKLIDMALRSGKLSSQARIDICGYIYRISEGEIEKFKADDVHAKSRKGIENTLRLLFCIINISDINSLNKNIKVFEKAIQIAENNSILVLGSLPQEERKKFLRSLSLSLNVAKRKEYKVKDLHRCSGMTINFSGAIFSGDIGKNHRFDDCDLSGSKFKRLYFRWPSFSCKKASKVDFSETRWGEGKVINTNFEGSIFSDSRITATVISDTNCSNVDFSGTIFVDVSFIGVDLRDANFSRVKMRTRAEASNFPLKDESVIRNVQVNCQTFVTTMKADAKFISDENSSKEEIQEIRHYTLRTIGKFLRYLSVDEFNKFDKYVEDKIKGNDHYFRKNTSTSMLKLFEKSHKDTNEYKTLKKLLTERREEFIVEKAKGNFPTIT